MTTTPRLDGFRMPAEWDRHAGCVMIWPERPDNWRDGARPAQAAFAAVAAAIGRYEPVTMIASRYQTNAARGMLPDAVRLLPIGTDDSWARDIGPIFVTDANRRVRAVDFRFNAWGGREHGLYAPWDRDDALARHLCEALDVRRYRAPCVLEGGAIHVDGAGTALVTEACLLDPARNPGVTQAAMARWLGDYLGVTTIIWLGDGIPEDETGGHIDNLACFAAPGRVLLAWCDDPTDPHYAVSRAAAARLDAATDAQGRRLTIEKLPMPPKMTMTQAESAGVVAASKGMNRAEGAGLAASYANFYIANDAVIAPAFGAETDDAARGVLERNFPGRDIVMLPAREILLGGGNIHCITCQIPEGISG